MTSCGACQELSKRLRIFQSDYQFELKKLAEDKSTEKALYEISMQKEIRKMADKYTKERDTHEIDNKNWLDKYDSTVASYTQRFAAATREATVKVQAAEHNAREEISEFRRSQEAACQTKIRLQEETCSATVTELKGSQHKQIANLKEAFEKSTRSMKQSHDQQFKQKVKELQSFIAGVSSEKRAEEKMHVQTKKQHEAKLAKIYEEMYQQKKAIITLEDSLAQLKRSLNQLKTEMASKQSEMERLSADHLEQLNYANMNNQNLLDCEKSKYRESLKEVYSNSIAQCQKYTLSLRSIQQKRQSEFKIFQESIEEIQNSVEDRPSRAQDIEEISHLRGILGKKQKEIGMFMEELKWYRLELSNKEETYNRIFVSQHNANIQQSNENAGFAGRKKEFKLRRAGKSVTSVREILNTMASGELEKRNNAMSLVNKKPKIL